MPTGHVFITCTGCEVLGVPVWSGSMTMDASADPSQSPMGQLLCAQLRHRQSRRTHVKMPSVLTSLCARAAGDAEHRPNSSSGDGGR